jgi:hypothetical protein
MKRSDDEFIYRVRQPSRRAQATAKLVDKMNKRNPPPERIFETVQRLFKERHPDVEPHRACIYLTRIGLEVIRQHTSHRAVVQAGTMQWEVVPRHLDDGVMGTHLAFKWSPREFNSVMNMAAGGIPEMHVWIALPERNEIVDFSTGTFPAFAQTLGVKWLSPPPPDFLWQDVGQAAAEGHFYEPNGAATELAWRIIQNL